MAPIESRCRGRAITPRPGPSETSRSSPRACVPRATRQREATSGTLRHSFSREAAPTSWWSAADYPVLVAPRSSSFARSTSSAGMTDDPGTRARGERRGSRAAQQQCTLADNRTRPDLADVLAVDLRDEHAVEDEVELIAGLALLDEDLADVQLAPGEIGVAAHELARELPFERALRRRHERLGLLVAPRRVLAVRLAIPGLEVDRPGLGGEVPVLVIDPVARERARSHDLVLGGPVRADRQRERRPRRGGVDAEKRPAADSPRRREPRATADGLHEPDRVVSNFRLRTKYIESYSRNREVLDPQSERRRADETPAFLAVTDDLPVVHLDPGLELVCLTEAVGVAQLLEVTFLQAVGRGLVVLPDPELERQLGHPLDRLGRDPGNRCDGRLDAHDSPFGRPLTTLEHSRPSGYP